MNSTREAHSVNEIDQVGLNGLGLHDIKKFHWNSFHCRCQMQFNSIQFKVYWLPYQHAMIHAELQCTNRTRPWPPFLGPMHIIMRKYGNKVGWSPVNSVCGYCMACMVGIVRGIVQHEDVPAQTWQTTTRRNVYNSQFLFLFIIRMRANHLASTQSTNLQHVAWSVLGYWLHMWSSLQDD
jgi:hypothetical protein